MTTHVRSSISLLHIHPLPPPSTLTPSFIKFVPESLISVLNEIHLYTEVLLVSLGRLRAPDVSGEKSLKIHARPEIERGPPFWQSNTLPRRNNIYRGSYMSGHLIWNLWNEFGILRALASKIPKLPDEFHKFHIKWPRM